MGIDSFWLLTSLFVDEKFLSKVGDTFIQTQNYKNFPLLLGSLKIGFCSL